MYAYVYMMVSVNVCLSILKHDRQWRASYIFLLLASSYQIHNIIYSVWVKEREIVNTYILTCTQSFPLPLSSLHPLFLCTLPPVLIHLSLHPFTLLITALLSPFLFLPLCLSLTFLLYVTPHDLSQQSLLPLSGTLLLLWWCASCCWICYRKWIMLVNKQSWVIMFQMMLYKPTLTVLSYLLLQCLCLCF